MRISPKYTTEDWKSLHLSIESEGSKWDKALDIFRDRFWGRFFKPVSLIRGCEFAGFAVMALDCLLIETLQQFRHGCKESPKGYYQEGTLKGRSRAKEFYASFFVDFCFDCFDKHKAETFYDEIRCGILHQAETKGNSLIRKVGELVAVTDDGKSLNINREAFHKKLLDVFEDYAKKLGDPSNVELRKNFIKKMNSICRLEV